MLQEGKEEKTDHKERQIILLNIILFISKFKM